MKEPTFSPDPNEPPVFPDETLLAEAPDVPLADNCEPSEKCQVCGELATVELFVSYWDDSILEYDADHAEFYCPDCDPRTTVLNLERAGNEAAIELLAACKAAERVLNPYIHHEPVEMCAMAEAWEAIKAAIAKAS